MVVLTMYVNRQFMLVVYLASLLLGIVDEVTGRGRGRVWRYKAYVELLNEGA
jgi:hypothetical protein